VEESCCAKPDTEKPSRQARLAILNNVFIRVRSPFYLNKRRCRPRSSRNGEKTLHCVGHLKKTCCAAHSRECVADRTSVVRFGYSTRYRTCSRRFFEVPVDAEYCMLHTIFRPKIIDPNTPPHSTAFF
jgi:hypothetical protein